MLVTNEMLFNLLQVTNKKLDRLAKLTRGKNLGEELSLHEFALIVHQDERTVVKELIKTGKIKARKVKSTKAKSGFTYKILDSEVVRFLRENHRHQNQKQETRLSGSSIDFKKIVEDFHKERDD